MRIKFCGKILETTSTVNATICDAILPASADMY